MQRRAVVSVNPLFPFAEPFQEEYFYLKPWFFLRQFMWMIQYEELK